MLCSVLLLKSVLEVRFNFSTWVWNWTCKPRCLFHIYLESKVPLKCTNKCIYNPVLFLDKRWCWHQSVFHQVLAEIPLVSFCKVFTNKRDLLFFIHFILRGIPCACFPSKHFLTGVVYNVQILIFMLQPLFQHFASLQHISNELLAGTL